MVKPMLAHIGSKEDLKHKNYFYEPKLDGTRAILIKEKSSVKLINRRGKRIAYRYPEIVEDAKNLPNGVYDGEICVLNKNGVPLFNKLQQRDQVDNKLKIKILSKHMPATYYIFDILKLGRKSLIKKKLKERKKFLETIPELNQIKKTYYTQEGRKLWKAIVKIKLEGVMAKHIDSPYIYKRSKYWLKIKNIQTTDCVILGYTKGKRQFASLVLGQYKEKELIYVGKVGTGFDRFLLESIYKALNKIKVKKAVFKDYKGKREVVWVRPLYVAEVKYLEYTKNNHLRAPAFVRLRKDKPIKDCILGS
jgi:bifunctional non-homologous end joining protein LigD